MSGRAGGAGDASGAGYWSLSAERVDVTPYIAFAELCDGRIEFNNKRVAFFLTTLIIEQNL